MNYASKCSGRQTQRSVQKGAAKHCQTKAYCPDPPAFGAPCPALELQQLWTSLQISHGKRAENIKTHSKISDPRWKMHSSPITGNGLTVSQQDLFKYKCRHGSWPSAPPSRQFLYPKGHFATTLSRPFSTTQCSMTCHSILGPKARWNSGSHQENSINLNSSCPSFITNCCFLEVLPIPNNQKIRPSHVCVGEVWSWYRGPRRRCPAGCHVDQVHTWRVRMDPNGSKALYKWFSHNCHTQINIDYALASTCDAVNIRSADPSESMVA